MTCYCKNFGFTPQGEEVFLYTLSNEQGFEVSISTYGATLTRLIVPISDKLRRDVILGYDRLDEYIADTSYSGATIGRVAGRISNACFTLNGVDFKLDKNEAGNTLHGGIKGFHNQVWQKTGYCDNELPSLNLSLSDGDAQYGFPGNVEITASFTLQNDGLSISYSATTDAPTPLSMTSHPYFNLDGDGRDAGSHSLKIFSDKTIQTGNNLIPDGKIIYTHNSKADFSNFTPIDGKIEENFGDPIQHDRFYILHPDATETTKAAAVHNRRQDIEMSVYTNQPGLQLYSGDYISTGTIGKRSCIYSPRSGFCIEPQGFPDAVNRPEFPSVILNPGKTYEHVTEYRFRTSGVQDLNR